MLHVGDRVKRSDGYASMVTFTVVGYAWKDDQLMVVVEDTTRLGGRELPPAVLPPGLFTRVDS